MTTNKQQYWILVLLVSIFSLGSCKNIMSGGKVDEGKIKFEITYLDDERDNPIIALLPANMTLKFKDNNTVSHIEGFFGTFKLSYISKLNDKKNYSLLRFLDKKYIYEVDTNALPFGYKQMENIKIEPTSEIKEIAGYKCQKAKVFCPDISNEPITVFYTTEIGIEHPNTNNPFRQINGVLLEFQVMLNGINMKFKAIEVVKEDIDDSEFEIPKGYKSVTKQNMEEIMESFTKTN